MSSNSSFTPVFFATAARTFRIKASTSLALACPAAMLYLLLQVTGIPATEAQAVLSRGDDYRNYQATTSMFVPWFPRQVTAGPLPGGRTASS